MLRLSRNDLDLWRATFRKPDFGPNPS